ncbi:PLAC8-domain-containing protein [Coniochaeta sp. PMI_546]|nr:PLAC8-domain-containing protein [Coniochaeta sp. PMI_546]
MGDKWLSDLCGCSGPCFSACCCPCILIGKNQARLENPRDRDPGCCNAWCVGYCALEMAGHWGFILGMLQRKQVRDRYDIKGGGCSDCCVSLCCPCCGLLQQANEMEERQSMLDKRGYRPQGAMRMQ